MKAFWNGMINLFDLYRNLLGKKNTILYTKLLEKEINF